MGRKEKQAKGQRPKARGGTVGRPPASSHQPADAEAKGQVVPNAPCPTPHDRISETAAQRWQVVGTCLRGTRDLERGTWGVGLGAANKLLGLGRRGFWRNCLMSVSFSAILLFSLVFASWPITETAPELAPLSPEDLPALSLQDPITHGNTHEKLIALTFDDGLKLATLDILSILKESKAKATWFVTGRSLAGNEAILSELIKNGDEIANHTFNHANLPTLSPEQVKEELTSTDEQLKKLVPNLTRYWRPPGGEMNDDVVRVARSLGLINVLWSVTTSDFVPDKTEDAIVADLLSLKPGDIVLLHNSPVVAMHNALRRALPELAQQGYRFVTVTELLRAE